MIGGITDNPINLVVVRAVGIAVEQSFTGLDRFVVFVLNEIDLGDVVLRLFLEFGTLFQTGELNQRIVVFSHGIVDISHVIGCGFAISFTDLADSLEVGTCLFPFSGLQE